MGRKSTTAWLILIDGLLLVRERADIRIGVVILSIVAHGLTVPPCWNATGANEHGPDPFAFAVKQCFANCTYGGRKCC
ncbi:hypothetical protein BA896_021570 [Janthinobacterium lividum]|uniref:Uncharacterized protein n=1 Tax=Janthinobacterium lividum TaxID=29581 RepID=A0A1E8PJI0_9BURK|nr:hypothetical protein BA896_021570 [Janthinobacterium lividum]